MMTFDRDDLHFQLFDVANIEEVLNIAAWEDIDRSTILGLLDTAEKLAEEHFQSGAKKVTKLNPNSLRAR